jgi:hypothetical protein
MSHQSTLSEEEFDGVVAQLRKSIVEKYPQTIVAVSNWLKLKRPDLRRKFNWKIPPHKGFDPSEYSSNAAANVALKYFLARRWRFKGNEGRLRIAHWVIETWGRVTTNSETTIEKHMRNAKSWQARYSHAGIASLSKILAVTKPDKFAVYDARVAAALNAIQLSAKVSKGIAFRYCSGRNVVIAGKRDGAGKLVRRGFVHYHPLRWLAEVGWDVPKGGENYLTYLAVLLECKRRLQGSKLAELEMTLFSHAEDLCVGQGKAGNT